MNRPTAIVFQSYFFDRRLARAFRRIRDTAPAHFRCYLSLNLSAGAQAPTLPSDILSHIVTTRELRAQPYPGKVHGSVWSVWDGHTDLPFLHFAHSHPEFERYWYIEYDVRFSGSWSRLFAAFEYNDADFLSTSLRDAITDPGWIYWPTICGPEAAPVLQAQDRIVGFMPIYRASRAAVQAMDQAYRAGWSGHCEGTWPTLIHHAGLRVEDIGGYGAFVRPENRGRFYRNTPKAWNLSPGTFVFRPVKHFAGFRRNLLWHPVKPLGAALQDDMRRVQEKFQTILRRIRSHGFSLPTLHVANREKITFR